MASQQIGMASQNHFRKWPAIIKKNRFFLGLEVEDGFHSCSKCSGPTPAWSGTVGYPIFRNFSKLANF